MNNKYCLIEQDKIRSVIRGHLLSLNKVSEKLKFDGHELFRTHQYTIIVTDFDVSFKKKNTIIRFKYEDIGKFFLKDCETFVIVREYEDKRHYFLIK